MSYRQRFLIIGQLFMTPVEVGGTEQVIKICRWLILKDFVSHLISYRGKVMFDKSNYYVTKSQYDSNNDLGTAADIFNV